MKKIFLIRHAESESNAGGIYEHNYLVKITEKGKQQAKDLVEILSAKKEISKPNKIIVSKYIRTQETAEPLIQKLQKEKHKHEVHLWLDVHEFDYLDRGPFLNKPKEEFEKHAKEYWSKADPFVRFLPERETFQEFVDRVHGTILKMQKLDKTNYIFTHGHFIALFGYLTKFFTAKTFKKQKSQKDFYKKIMSHLHELYNSGDYLQAKNTEIIDVTRLVEKYNK